MESLVPGRTEWKNTSAKSCTPLRGFLCLLSLSAVFGTATQISVAQSDKSAEFNFKKAVAESKSAFKQDQAGS
jgi:hypothetical protein